jgi:GPI inositol-deacylase
MDTSTELTGAWSHGTHNLPDSSSHSRTSSCSARRPEAHQDSRSGTPQPSTTTIRRPSSNGNWKPAHTRNGSAGQQPVSHTQPAPAPRLIPANGDVTIRGKESSRGSGLRLSWKRDAWNLSILTLVTAVFGLSLLVTILNSSVTRQMDPKGCRMSWMSPVFYHMKEFDTEHTKFASKYSLYLYREGGVNDVGDASVG